MNNVYLYIILHLQEKRQVECACADTEPIFETHDAV